MSEEGKPLTVSAGKVNPITKQDVEEKNKVSQKLKEKGPTTFAKKRKVEELKQKESLLENEQKYFIQLVNGDDQSSVVGPTCEVDANFTATQLHELLNTLLQNEEELPYTFLVEGKSEIKSSIRETLLLNVDEFSKDRKQISTQEEPLKIVFYPQAIFRVRPVTRCTASLPGHSEAVLAIAFSPDGSQLASASGDATVRLWDLNSETPYKTLQGHTHWVLCLAWSPDAKIIASGGKDSIIKTWYAENGQKCSKPLKGHKQYITALSWEPYHLNPKCQRLVSASKDETLMVWNVILSKCEFCLSGHTKSVTGVTWAGDGHIYSCGQDCTIRVWNPETRQQVKLLTGHAHWVNTMAMSTDYVLRRGAFDFNCNPLGDKSLEELQKEAKIRYEKETKGRLLRIVTGSDDNTLCIWEPEKSEKPIARLTGHQGVVNQVCFSPDGRIIASASFDKSIKIWEASTGKFLGTLRGHVGAVYRVAWSGDSRMLASASKDSTAKVWNVINQRIEEDLPGHFDEVYAVDWAPDGQRVATGGKDRVLKIWRN